MIKSLVKTIQQWYGRLLLVLASISLELIPLGNQIGSLCPKGGNLTMCNPQNGWEKTLRCGVRMKNYGLWKYVSINVV
jgi:hypothetical protein